MIINIILFILGLFLFHTYVYPIIDGFIDGYRDAKNGRPYNDKEEE
tara:strand:- start:14557 stop:14694 length:138 start_codon:yes stop_codon:yes gene_type:complete